MTQIRIFRNTDPDRLEINVNRWLMENSKTIKVNDIRTIAEPIQYIITVTYEEIQSILNG